MFVFILKTAFIRDLHPYRWVQYFRSKSLHKSFPNEKMKKVDVWGFFPFVSGWKAFTLTINQIFIFIYSLLTAEEK